MALSEGKVAPAFTLPAHNGEKVSLKDFKGKKQVVLFFYPKDNTSGCTKEVCALKENIDIIEGKDAVVLGVNRDSLKSHVKFVEKFELPFLLLSDEDEEICKKYDVIKEKVMCGNATMGIERSTFIIGKDGKIKKIFRKVKVDGHAEEVLAALKE